MDKIVPFDWQRMFFGDQPPLFLLEIVLRVAVVFACAILLLQLTGKRARRELTSFDLLIIVALGSAVGDVLFYPSVPISYALVVLVTVVVLNRLVAHVQSKSSRAYDLLAGQARLVVRDGVVLEDALRKESLAADELLSMLREAGVAHTSQVKRAYLELSGELGVIRVADAERHIRREVGVTTLPEDDRD